MAAESIFNKAKPYRLKAASMGKVLPGYDLAKALQLSAQLEDEEIARKLDILTVGLINHM